MYEGKHEYSLGIAEDLERSDWTPEEALRWYAAGKHFDTMDNHTRIIDTGAIASNALKHASLQYLELKGDSELSELRAELASLKAGQGEAVAIAECREVHGHMCQFLNRTQHGMDTLRDGDKLYAAPPASADAVSVPRETMERLIAKAAVFDDGSDGADAESARSVAEELRAMLAQLESKEVGHE